MNKLFYKSNNKLGVCDIDKKLHFLDIFWDFIDNDT